jgi:DNA-binding Xre family transcriptional regulator
MKVFNMQTKQVGSDSGVKLRKVCAERGIPLHIVTYRAKVSGTTLSKWSKWNILPREETIQKVAEVLGVQPEDII